MSIEDISDEEVAKIKVKYEQNPMTCWFCRKTIPWEQLESIEEHENFAAYGYCYCKKCIGKLRQAVRMVKV